ncbi:MAG: HAMP domain-containing sensor histidine kinase [Candidatus Ozemobacteraceae bacterium]
MVTDDTGEVVPTDPSVVLAALRKLISDVTKGHLPAAPVPELEAIPEAAHFIDFVRNLQDFSLALSQGNLGAKIPGKGPIIGSLKALQASLRHLTWQTKLVAGGDFTQHVDFMGEFAQAFNIMTGRLDQAYRDLQERNQELEAFNRIQQRITAIVAHDLRSPLSGILGGLKYVLEETNITLMEDEQRDFLLMIKNSTIAQIGLINRLLNLTSLQRSMRSVVREPVPIKALIEEAAGAVRPLCEVKRLWLRLDVQDGLAPLGDSIRLGQVIANLLNNALKFTESGGVTITARKRGEEVLVVVEDTGKGIPPDVVPKVFLGNLTTSGTAGEEGSGIGLPLCREIIAAHDGRLWVESQLNHGSRFCFALPAAVAKTSDKSTEKS